MAYPGVWGYHPQVVSLASDAGPLYLVNRSGSQPSSEHAADSLDRAAARCRRAEFRKVTPRRDTEFTQARYLDRWDREGTQFIFGAAAMANLLELAGALPAEAYGELEHPSRSTIKTVPRRAGQRHMERLVAERLEVMTRLTGLLESLLADGRSTPGREPEERRGRDDSQTREDVTSGSP